MIAQERSDQLLLQTACQIHNSLHISAFKQQKKQTVKTMCIFKTLFGTFLFGHLIGFYVFTT